MIELNRILDFNFFYVVCRWGYFEIVKFLVFKGVDVNIYDSEEKSFLYLVCVGENIKVVEYLLIYDVDINICSFFNMMCENGNCEIVRFLLNYGVDINLCDEDGLSLLYFVCEEGYFGIV